MNISWMPNVLKKRLAGKGAGDLVKESIDTVSGGKIKQCGACKKRQQLLNDLLSFEDKKTLERAAQIQAEAQKKLAEQTSDNKELSENPKVSEAKKPSSNPFYANPNIKVIDGEFSHKSLYGEILNMDVPIYRYQSIDNKLTKVIELLTEIAESERKRDSDSRD
tara:strand:+ start:800 stop:1291 length:492 start_codon:yes stop_codon:yes gene_type:complete